MKSNNSEKKEVSSFYNRFSKFSIQFRIKFENELVLLSNYVQILIRIFQCFQLVGMILLIYASDSGDLSVFNLLVYLSKIARPYLFIQGISSFYKFSYLIVLSPLFLGYLSLVYLNFRIEQKNVPLKQMLSCMWKQNIVVIGSIHLCIYIQILFQNLLIIPIIDLLAQSYYHNLSVDAASIINLILITVTSIWITAILYIEYQITLESINIDCNNFGSLRRNITDLIQTIIELVMVVINVTLQGEQNCIYYLAILVLIIGILSNYAVFKNYANIYQNQIVQLAISNFQIIMGIVFFSLQLFQTKISRLQIILLITLYFPLNSVMMKQFEIHYQNLLFPKAIKMVIQKVHYRIANIYQISKVFPNTYQLVLFNILRKTHQDQCDNIACKCSQTINTETFINIYMGLEILHLNQLIAETRNLQERFIYFLHYLSLMNELGYNSQAFQQTNMLGYQSSDKGSQYRSSATHRVSLHSLDQNSKNNRTKVIKEEGHHSIKLGKLDMFQTCKLYIIQDKIKYQMGSNFVQQDQSLSESLEHAVKLFLQSEIKNQTIKARILLMLDTKKNFLLQIMKLENIQTLFYKSKAVAISLQELEIQLQQQHDKFPSQKMKALNCFFQAEIMNNYFQAFKISNLSSISDEKLLKMHAQFSFDLFQSRIDYLNIGFDEKSNRLQIKQRSNLAFDLFEYKQEKFNLIQFIGPLLPDGFESIHDDIVQGFFSTGSSKYFRKINISFIRTEEAYIKPVNFFFDLNSENLNEMAFVGFFKNIDTQNAFIFITNTSKIANISKNLCNKFGISSKYLPIVQAAMTKSKIQRWIPSYCQYIENQIENIDSTDSNYAQISSQLFAIEFKLINPELIAEPRLSQESQDKYLLYEVDLIIHIRENEFNNQYSIIEIQNARQTKSQLQVQNPTHIYEDDQVAQFNEDIFSEQVIVVPYYLEDKLETASNKLQNRTDYQMMAPILESSRIKYFKANQTDQKSESYQEQSLREQENINKINQIQFDDIDQDMQDNIRMQMQIEKIDAKVIHIDDIGSQVSSIAGIKTSRFYKKYQFIEKVLTSTKFSIKYDMMNAFIILIILIFQIQCILYFVNAEQDLSRFLEEISMIQIRTNIIGPINKYIVAQNILVYYVVDVIYGLMSNDRAKQKAQFTEFQYISIYASLKQSLQQQLSNPYFLPFIFNQNLTVQQAYYPKTTNRTIAVNEVLFILLESNFELTLTDFQTIITFDTSQAFVVYQYLNYALLNGYCKSLNEDILNYSIQRANTVKTKWYYILIPCLITSFCLISTGYFYYQEYISQYVKILSFYQLADLVWLLRDVERYKAIMNLLQKDDDVMFKYTFDIDLKEKFMMAEDFRKENLAQKQKIKKNTQKLELGNAKMPFIKNVMMFGLVYAIYFVFCFVSNALAQTYFEKYPDTTMFFNKLSDLEAAVTGVFAMRQLAYQIKSVTTKSYYFFPNASDADYFIEQFQLDLAVISNFLQISSSLDPSLFITSDSFINQFALLIATDTCNFLPIDLFTIAQPHCDAVYGGVLRIGFQTALTYMRDALQNELITSNQFAYQVLTLEEQMEGGLIAATVVSTLRGQFQTFLVNQTNRLISDINVINAIGTIFNLIGFLTLLTLIRNYYIWEFSIVKRFLLLLPQSSLFLDSQIERQLRQIIVQDNLL